jgi:hypothetical protein
MGADNQAEKVIDRIERMERMQAEIERLKADNKHWQTIASQGIAIEHELRIEIERLNIRIRQDAEKALQYLNEIDRLKELVAALRQEMGA